MVSDHDNGRTRGPIPRVSDTDIIRTLREDRELVLTTKDVAERLPIEQRRTYDRLKRLKSDGRIESKDVGPRAKVWWAKEDPREPNPVNPDDPIFNRTTFTAGEPHDASENVDYYVAKAAYEDAHGEGSWDE